MIRTCKIVMKKAEEPVRIPLNESTIFKNEDGLLSTVHNPSIRQIPYYLYIISSDQIKHGDWCLVGDNVVKYDSAITTQKELETNWEKIIASSDPNLIVKERGVTACSSKHDYDFGAYWEITIPNLPYGFIKGYCEQENNNFEYVLVLYDSFNKPYVTENNQVIILGFVKFWN